MEKQGNILEDRIEEAKSAGDKTGLDYRLCLIALMGIFVVFVMCWGVYHVVCDIEQEQITSQPFKQQTKKNETSAGEALDVDALIKTLLQEVSFETELKKLDDSVAEGMITAETGTKLQMYMGNGSYADEIIVMTAGNEENAKKNQENVKAHLEEMKQMFQDYIPKEAKKIEDAVMVRCGCYVIVCVTKDTDMAADVVNSAIDK